MLNYEGLAEIAVEKIIEDMNEKMMHENYCIHKAIITVDVEHQTMTVEAIRKDPLGIEFKAKSTVNIGQE